MDDEAKRVILLEMSCPWIGNRKQKAEEKTAKYAPLRWELRKQYPSYKIEQYNIIMDMLGGYSKELYSNLKPLLAEKKAKELLQRMQKSVLSSCLNIARSFKILSN